MIGGLTKILKTFSKFNSEFYQLIWILLFFGKAEINLISLLNWYDHSRLME